jgi:hypothetical protein
VRNTYLRYITVIGETHILSKFSRQSRGQGTFKVLTLQLRIILILPSSPASYRYTYNTHIPRITSEYTYMSININWYESLVIIYTIGHLLRYTIQNVIPVKINTNFNILISLKSFIYFLD